MTYDVYVNEDRDIQFDPTGDIQTVSGVDNVLQQYMNAAFRAIESANITRFNANTREDIQVEIQEELADLGYPEVISRMQIEQSGHDTMTITIVARGVSRTEEVEL